jgi:hypothetical protein
MYDTGCRELCQKNTGEKEALIHAEGRRMRIVYLVLISLAGAIFVVHIALTPMFYSTLTANTMWYVGTGMFGIALAVLNFMNYVTRSPHWIVTVKTIASNFAAGVYFTMLAVVLNQVQAWAAVLLVAGLFIFSVFLRPNRQTEGDSTRL